MNNIKEEAVKYSNDINRGVEPRTELAGIVSRSVLDFHAGATSDAAKEYWQEKLQPVIKSHAELFAALELMFKSCAPKDVTPNKKMFGLDLGKTYVGECGIPSDEAIHKAKKAL